MKPVNSFMQILCPFFVLSSYAENKRNNFCLYWEVLLTDIGSLINENNNNKKINRKYIKTARD